jgi:NADH:ubiquinone oxidoreductase subunit E
MLDNNYAPSGYRPDSKDLEAILGPLEADVLNAVYERGKPIRVREVVTFYTMFYQLPMGKYHIQVCSNLTCSLMGGDKLIDYLQKKLGTKIGETTADRRFTLSEVECLGACEQAPCMMVNLDYYGNLDKDKIDAILKGLD